MMDLLRRIFRRRPRPPVSLICVRQADTWTWPDYLGEKTAGVCGRCGAGIFYERQNAGVETKVCSNCAWGVPK